MGNGDNVFGLKAFPPRTLEDSVYATLCFFDVFDHPLTLNEVNVYLLGKTASVSETGLALMAHERIDYSKGYFFLEGRKKLVERRLLRKDLNKWLWERATKYVPLLKAIPYIKMVGVCNNLALGTADKDSDIDLFIITKKNRIFTGRILSGLLYEILKIRRNNKVVAGQFCMSFYLNEAHLDLSKMQSGNDFGADIYLMYWILTLKPFFGIKTYNAFVTENLWIKKYFPNWNGYLMENKRGFDFAHVGSKAQEIALNNFFGDFLESKLKKWHLERLNSRKESLSQRADVVVNDYLLKFHNVDRRAEFNARFFEKYLR